jgi:hypothetical protein
MEYSTDIGVTWVSAQDLASAPGFSSANIIPVTSTPNQLQIRYKAVTDAGFEAFASTATSSVAIQERPTAPTAVTLELELATNQLRGTTDLMQYRIGISGAWIACTASNTTIDVADAVTVYVRIAPTDDRVVSLPHTITVEEQDQVTGLTVNFATEVLTNYIAATMEYSTDNGVSWLSAQDLASVSGFATANLIPAGTTPASLLVRLKADGLKLASLPQDAISIPPRPNAPTVVTAVGDEENEIFVEGGEEVIILTIGSSMEPNTLYEYSIDNGTTWIDLPADEITEDVTSATTTIWIRIKATGDAFASLHTAVTVTVTDSD